MSAATKPAWTPGPWAVESNRHDPFLIIGPRKNCSRHGKKDTWELASVGSEEFWYDRAFKAQDLANARLIAAAPDLYAALEALLPIASRNEQSDATARAKAALAKARGQA